MNQKRRSWTMRLWEVLKKTAINWNTVDPWRQSAILAYYSIFSLPALLLILIVLAGRFFGQETVSRELSQQIADLMGRDVAMSVELMISNIAETESSAVALIAGIGFLLFGATTVFYHLQLSLNRIWGVVPRPRRALLKYIRDRLLSFGLILAVGFLLILSLTVSTLLAVLGDYIRQVKPDLIMPLINAFGYLVSIAVTSTLFAMMFKILPDAKIRWKSVWVGAVLTALLFSLGQYGLSVYFKFGEPASVYGAAGAVILILIWTSYVALILLFGAAFTRQWAVHFGYGITPAENAELVMEDNDTYQYHYE